MPPFKLQAVLGSNRPAAVLCAAVLVVVWSGVSAAADRADSARSGWFVPASYDAGKARSAGGRVDFGADRPIVLNGDWLSLAFLKYHPRRISPQFRGWWARSRLAYERRLWQQQRTWRKRDRWGPFYTEADAKAGRKPNDDQISNFHAWSKKRAAALGNTVAIRAGRFVDWGNANDVDLARGLQFGNGDLDQREWKLLRREFRADGYRILVRKYGGRNPVRAVLMLPRYGAGYTVPLAPEGRARLRGRPARLEVLVRIEGSFLADGSRRLLHVLPATPYGFRFVGGNAEVLHESGIGAQGGSSPSYR